MDLSKDNMNHYITSWSESSIAKTVTWKSLPHSRRTFKQNFNFCPNARSHIFCFQTFLTISFLASILGEHECCNSREGCNKMKLPKTNK